MISDVKSSLILSILGIDPPVDVLDMRGHSYFIATAKDLRVRSSGETFPVLLHTTKDRNRPICETIKTTIDLGFIFCALVSGEKYSEGQAALFFLKSKEDASLVDKLIA